MKTIFTFDLKRGYQPNDINNYRKIIHKLTENYPWDFEIKQETVKNTHEDWIKLQNGISYSDFSTLNIFFEMPEADITYCKIARIPYLNFMTSKYRFPKLKDVIMVESNLKIPFILSNEELKKDIPHYRYITPSEDYYKQFIGKTIALGQMYGDRSVIFNGESHSIFDYEFEADIYRPHPHVVLYQPDYYKKELQLAKERGIEVIERGDIYQILHSCKKVIGISSSTLYEAELMNKEVVFLNEKEYIRDGKIIYWDKINKEFWEKIRSQV